MPERKRLDQANRNARDREKGLTCGTDRFKCIF